MRAINAYFATSKATRTNSKLDDYLIQTTEFDKFILTSPNRPEMGLFVLTAVSFESCPCV